MNILPKKSWHVRTKANIERVRKDEAQAAEEEKERLRKIALAESEARTDILRQRARKRPIEDDAGEQQQQQVVASTSTGHINFFQELEEGKKQDGKGNKEYEEEKRQEKEKQEKAIGLLTYLGQSAVEAQTSKPWYFKPPEKKSKLPEDSSAPGKSREEFDRKSKLSLDPMRTMSKYVEKTKKVHKHKDKNRDDDHHRDKRHKHKKHKKHKDTEEGPSVHKPKTIEQLRAERLQREKEEREKTAKLMAKLRGENIPGETQEEPTDERDRRYNSQYNPDFVRKRKPRDHMHY